MPIFTKTQLERIRAAIRKHHLAAAAKVAGLDSLSLEEQASVSTTSSPTDVLRDAYRSGQDASPSQVEQDAVDLLKQKFTQSVRKLMVDYEGKINDDVIAAAQAARRASVEGDEERAAEEKKKALKGLAQQLNQRNRDAKKNWKRLSASELHGAHQQGVADALRVQHGGGIRVFKQIAPDACKWCRALHVGPDGKPRVFTLDELEDSNVGRTKDQWKAVIGPVHPNCQCELVMIPDGWSFDASGKLQPPSFFKSLKTKKFAGMELRIETDVGEKRWPDAPPLPCAYGYIVNTKAADGEEYDCFVGPYESAAFAYVVHQKGKDCIYDEDKVMLGMRSADEAKRMYFASYKNAEELFGSISMLPISEFKRKVYATTQPAQDGMVKSQFVVKGYTDPVPPSDNPTPPQYPAGATGAPHQFAGTSQAGARNVNSGTTGPNILFQTPQPPHAGTNPELKRKDIDTHVEDQHKGVVKERTRRKISVDKLREDRIADATPIIVKPYEPWQDRAKNDDEARKDAPERKKQVETKLEERNESRKVSPYRTDATTAQYHIRPHLLSQKTTKASSTDSEGK